MQEIKCPKCGEVFQVDESGYAAIVKQVRDTEFEKEIKQRESSFETEKKNAVDIAVAKLTGEKDKLIAELNAKLDTQKSQTKIEAEKVASDKDKLIAEKEFEILKLKGELELSKTNTDLSVKNAVSDKDAKILELESQIKLSKSEWDLKEKSIMERHTEQLKLKDDEIAYYKDFKSRQSTKMVGESLEQHCEIEFNKLRATAFQSAYFEKDNDARTGSKGDFIYRESSDDGVEFISIMFEMKNEMDTTATKHKNEDFFKELDKDRKEKNCE